MEKTPIYFLIFFISLTVVSINAQNTFNKSITLGYPYTNFTSIEINDTSIFCAGIYVDSIAPFAQGVFLYEMDMQGKFLKEYSIADSTDLKHVWKRNLSWINDSTIYNIGYYKNRADDWSKGLIIEYDIKNKRIVREENIDNPPRGMQPQAVVKGFDGNFKLVVNNGEFFSSFVTLDSNYEINKSEYINSNSFRAFFSRSMAKGNGKYYIASVRSNQNTADRGFVIQNIITVFDSSDQKVTEYQTPATELWESPESILVTDDGEILITSKTGREILDGRFGLLLLDPTVYKLKEDSITNQLVRDWTLTFSNGWEYDAFQKRITKIISTKNKKEFLGIGARYNSLLDPEKDENVIKSFMVKFTDDGDSLWTREYEYLTDGGRHHELNDIIAAPDGGYYLCGLISDFRDSISAKAPYRRGWLMKVDEHGCLIPGCEKISSISEQSEIIDIKLYPNPADDFINFQVTGFPRNSNFSCRIVDLQGRILKTFNQLNSDVTYFYAIDDLSNGVYILQISNENGIVASKQIVVN